MSNKRIINFAYFVSALLLFYVLGALTEQAWGYFQLTDHMFVGRLGIPWAIALALTAATLVFAFRHERINQFLLEVVAELREVTWPTRQEVISHTKVVIVATLILAVILGAFDIVWAKVSKFLLNPNI